MRLWRFGYSLLRDSEIAETFPVGWFGSVAWNLTDEFAIVGEASGQGMRDSVNFA